MDIVMLIAFLAVLILPNVFKKLNVSIFAVTLAFICGFFVMVPDKAYTVSSETGAGKLFLAGLPGTLLFNLVAVSLFFAVARSNGTLEQITRKILKLANGNNKIIPFICYFLGIGFCIIGTGTIPTGMMLYPLIYQICVEQKLDYLPCSLALAMGNHVGGLAPTSPVGLIAVNTAASCGVELGWTMWKQFALIGTVVFVIYYFISGVWKVPNTKDAANIETVPFTKEQKVTIIFIILFAVCIMVLGLQVGLCATVALFLIMIINNVDFKSLVSMVPWNTIILVGCMSMFAEMMKVAGTMDTVTDAILNIVSPFTAAALFMLAAGIMSLVTSASSVVIPTMVPIAVSVAAAIGINPIPLITAVCFGAHRTASSPLSTGGAMIIGLRGAVDDTKDTLYSGLFKWVFITLGISVALAFTGILNLFL